MRKFGELSRKEQVELFEAMLDGKTVQWKYNEEGDWAAKKATNFENNFFYRIKYTPKDIWVNEYGNNTMNYYPHSTKESAEQAVMRGYKRKAVHYREVIDE